MHILLKCHAYQGIYGHEIGIVTLSGSGSMVIIDDYRSYMLTHFVQIDMELRALRFYFMVMEDGEFSCSCVWLIGSIN